MLLKAEAAMTNESIQRLHRLIEGRLFWRTEQLTNGPTIVGSITLKDFDRLVVDLIEFIGR